MADSLDDALKRVEAAKKSRKGLSIGLIGNAAEVIGSFSRADSSLNS